MNAWTLVREQAQAFHRRQFPLDGLVPAAQLLSAAVAASGVSIRPRPPGDSLLDGGEACYDAEGPYIFVSNALSPEDQAFHVAHEFGHHLLHRENVVCESNSINPSTPAHANTSLVGGEDDYSPKERREAQANLFAREFLLPSDKLRAASAVTRPKATQLAADLGLPEALVRHQMADTFLLPVGSGAAKSGKNSPSPDDSQCAAIRAEDKPVLVRAGPGTGKTRTLVGRIGRLLQAGVRADSILALTYSNDSAADLATRIRAEWPDQAAQVWSGTFHAFGLELLRKFGERIGLPIDLRLLDRPSALFKMESLLAQLDLDHYLDLHEPVRGLKAVLNAISRAKDELCSAQRYAELAAAMSRNGADPESCAKATEVARAYRCYDAACRADGLVDFGDLIARSVELLTLHPDVLEQVRTMYPHVLVDEYQDANAASRQLLMLLVRQGKGPWVVGDVRQSIYRFRGASPLNITRFSDTFAGATVLDLNTNYRSHEEIVSAFHTFGKVMACAPFASSAKLHAHRCGGGRVLYSVAATREAEANGIAGSIRADLIAGGHASDHAILGRAHSTLVRIAEHLERCDIPCLYFGNFFERPEIRDLLSLLSIASEYDGLGLVRVASAAPFSVPKDDILRVFAYRREHSISLLESLRAVADIDGLSADGRLGLSRLADVFRDVGFATQPGDVLLSYLFDFGAVWQGPLDQAGVPGQQRRLAVYQLLQLALSLHPSSHKADPKRTFLQHIRTLEVLDEEKELRKPPAIAEGVDAVQIMTVHASKGLEFPIVHVPALSPSYFPAQPRYQPAPAPPGLIPDDPVMTPAAEEEGLFYVALSRARDQLRLSRAEHYGGASRPKESPLLSSLASILPKPQEWHSEGPTPPPWPRLPVPTLADTLSVSALETYLDCPRRYYYQELLALHAAPPKRPNLQMMSSVRASFAHLRDHKPGAEAETAAAIEATWAARGPVDHPLESTYRTHANRMLDHARASMRGTPLPIDRTLIFGGATLAARADHIFQDGAKVIVQRLKMGRLTKSKETLKAKYTVLQTAVRADTKASVAFEHVSLVTGERREETASTKDIDKVHGQLQDAMHGIAHGHFDPTPNERQCPTCPYFFLCPADGVPTI